jgi:4'-phosphopantetheinyl transferase
MASRLAGEVDSREWGPTPASVSPLEPGDVHVWSVALDVSEPSLRVLEEICSPAEKERAGRFHFARDRHRFLASRGRLRLLIARYTGVSPDCVAFGTGSRGKPYLIRDETGLEFNLAHSHALALVAFTHRREIGVDVEYLSREVSVEQIAERFFSPAEAAALRDLPDESRRTGFFACWTRKEAFLKANGQGIAFGLDRFTVSLAPGAPAALLETPFDPAEAARWSLRTLQPGRDYLGAVAVRGPIRRLHCWGWEEETHLSDD